MHLFFIIIQAQLFVSRTAKLLKTLEIPNKTSGNRGALFVSYFINSVLVAIESFAVDFLIIRLNSSASQSKASRSFVLL